MLASIDGSEVLLWDVARGQPIRSVEQAFHVLSVAFSLGGKSLAILTHNDLVLHDLGGRKEGQVRRALSLDEGSYDRMASLAPNHKTLVTVGSGGLLQIWDMTTGKKMRKFLEGFEGRWAPVPGIFT